jgi:hypothetical protein
MASGNPKNLAQARAQAPPLAGLSSLAISHAQLSAHAGKMGNPEGLIWSANRAFSTAPIRLFHALKNSQKILFLQ